MFPIYFLNGLWLSDERVGAVYRPIRLPLSSTIKAAERGGLLSGQVKRYLWIMGRASPVHSPHVIR